MSAHLKPERMNDVLLGIAESETSAHLRECAQCRAEIEAMRRTLSSFRGAAIGWSEGTAVKVALPSQRRAPSIWSRSAWVLATATILLAVAISFSVRRGRSNDTTARTDAQSQIARDNQLLADIQTEIGETTPGPLQPLQVNTK
jgi:anti-sigma factor RsiW